MTNSCIFSTNASLPALYTFDTTIVGENLVDWLLTFFVQFNVLFALYLGSNVFFFTICCFFSYSILFLPKKTGQTRFL